MISANQTLYIHAPNVHAGGGRVMLDALLSGLSDQSNVVIIIDERYSKHLSNSKFRRKEVPPTFFSRLATEVWLSFNALKGDCIFSFGNLPPLFFTRSKKILFLQNKYLIANYSLASFDIKPKVRIFLERCWLKFKISSVDVCIVQSESMRRCFNQFYCGFKPQVAVIPYAPELKNIDIQSLNNNYEFIYMASGEPHKNHKKLILAWCELAKENLYPVLSLTLEEGLNKELLDWVAELKEQRGIRINNLGVINSNRVSLLLCQHRALIYPSTLESFGLPLIEAKQIGLSILASELDYVRDLVDPDETFDPHSELSIARAVRRFLRVPASKGDVLNPTQFARTLLTMIDHMNISH